MPTKRHPSLQPLSRHHHHALVLALHLIKQERSNDELRTELQHFWQNGGQEHFREEEEVLLPAYAKHAALDRPEIVQLLLEHVQVRSLISQICEDQRADKMQQLGRLLQSHVRNEEQVVFPLIESALPEAELARLAPYFAEHYTQ
ncbi:hemerythrin superfamily protein [Alicyclobacillus sacchari]|uniref:Hemerythrin superfamily protein n=1 Tax=Alicyclobacillus sacchari TaxID=392010 RepID=A0A4R8LNT3_9BACL|nr:hemerythrin domain-containing protein [Alicyclobacillus sacchari]TDY47948.1 hemerythrin superfamily protein [Alicyclobacillus sacchari]